MNDWFNVLKTQETITDLGLDFESPDEKLEPKDKRDCYQELVSIRDKIKDGHENPMIGYRKMWIRNVAYDNKKVQHFLYLDESLRDEYESETTVKVDREMYEFGLGRLGNDDGVLVNSTSVHKLLSNEDIPEDVACFALEMLEKWDMVTDNTSRYWNYGKFYHLFLKIDEIPLTGYGKVIMQLTLKPRFDSSLRNHVLIYFEKGIYISGNIGTKLLNVLDLKNDVKHLNWRDN
jgi:hypothetical protein